VKTKKMSCNRNAVRCAAGSVASGINKGASATANGAGVVARQVGDFAKEHPGLTSYLVTSAAISGAAIGVYQKKKDSVVEETGKLAGSNLDVSFQRSGNTAPTDQDRALGADIDYGMSQVLRQGVASNIGTNRVTIADDFAFANKTLDMVTDSLGKGNMRKRALGKYYKATKPLYTGNLYLNQKAARLLRGGTVYAVGTRRQTDEVAVSADSFQKDRYFKNMDKILGGSGQAARYTGAVIALNKAPRVKQPRGPFAQMRQNIYTDAIASRLIAPGYKGGRNFHGLCVRVADWNARRAAAKSGEDTMTVLARRLGTQA
jgi:hypothetical protein